jgi:hypothetical protein
MAVTYKINFDKCYANHWGHYDPCRHRVTEIIHDPEGTSHREHLLILPQILDLIAKDLVKVNLKEMSHMIKYFNRPEHYDIYFKLREEGDQKH